VQDRAAGLANERGLERRLSAAHIGRFKPLCDWDWTWPKHCDRAAVDALITIDFLKEAANVVFVGPNGVGKSMFAQNIAHQPVIDGHTVLFTSAGQLLGDLCALDNDSILQRRLRHYARPQWNEVFPNAACVVSLVDRLITRQRTDWQRQAARDLAEGRFAEAVTAFDRAGAITWSRTRLTRAP
jgi:DNA replication protein DnaC